LATLPQALAIGPFGAALFTDPMAILHVAELGVVMFLFIIGLEMQPVAPVGDAARHLRAGAGAGPDLRWVFLALSGVSLGYPFARALIAGTGFVLTSTAIVMQMLEERGDISTPKGQRIVSILLLEDLAIVPFWRWSPSLRRGARTRPCSDRLQGIGIGLGAIAALVLAGIYLLNPMFRCLPPRARAR
jgi:glutathione-regulated potassium-efflux system protein KefB